MFQYKAQPHTVMQEMGGKKHRVRQKANSKIPKVSPSLSVIALHVNGLDSPIKTQRLAE